MAIDAAGKEKMKKRNEEVEKILSTIQSRLNIQLPDSIRANMTAIIKNKEFSVYKKELHDFLMAELSRLKISNLSQASTVINHAMRSVDPDPLNKPLVESSAVLQKEVGQKNILKQSAEKRAPLSVSGVRLFDQKQPADKEEKSTEKKTKPVFSKK